jgi:iron complex transport system ATP-binding protein
VSPVFYLFDFQQVSVVREGRLVLKDVNLRVQLGEHIAILGPNGSGKSTLIKTITRELYPDENVPGFRFRILGGETWNIFELRKLLGIVSADQLSDLTRDLTAREVVLSGFFAGMGVWPHQKVTPAMERKAQSVLRFLEVSHLAERSVKAMSSGEQRRVLIGRALVPDPHALVLDEPTNSLDPRAVHEFRLLLQKLARAGKTIMLVTHHLSDLIPEIQRTVLIRKGKIVDDGPTRKTLTSAKLSQLFRTPIRVTCRGGVYSGTF